MAPHYSLLMCCLSLLIYYSPLYLLFSRCCFVEEARLFIQFPTFWIFFFILPHGLWDLSSSARDPTHSPLQWKEGQSLNHWTTRDLVDFITVIHVQFSRVRLFATP